MWNSVGVDSDMFIVVLLQNHPFVNMYDEEEYGLAKLLPPLLPLA
jgi:hypothetical protein